MQYPIDWCYMLSPVQNPCSDICSTGRGPVLLLLLYSVRLKQWTIKE